MPAVALAHPLGNFTINHYAGIRVESDRVILDVVIDQAEIPTFQEKLRIDTDSDGSVSDSEAEAERIGACPTLASTLSLTVAGQRLPLVPVAAGLSFPPGAAGLETMRLACTYVAALPAPLTTGSAVAFSDGSHKERLGWREVVVTGSGATVSAGGLPSSSVSKRLMTYPQDLLSSPLDLRSVSFSVRPGGPTLPPFSVPDAQPLPGAAALYPTDPGAAKGTAPPGTTVSPASVPASPAVTTGSAAVPGGVGGDIAGLLQTRTSRRSCSSARCLRRWPSAPDTPITPGHGKTLMGAYLVGTRGTAVQPWPGLSVTVFAHPGHPRPGRGHHRLPRRHVAGDVQSDRPGRLRSPRPGHRRLARGIAGPRDMDPGPEQKRWAWAPVQRGTRHEPAESRPRSRARAPHGHVEAHDHGHAHLRNNPRDHPSGRPDCRRPRSRRSRG